MEKDTSPVAATEQGDLIDIKINAWRGWAERAGRQRASQLRQSIGLDWDRPIRRATGAGMPATVRRMERQHANAGHKSIILKLCGRRWMMSALTSLGLARAACGGRWRV
jgi:hypothetical protein